MNNRVVIIAVVVVLFLAVAGFIVFRGVGGGGQSRTIDITISGSSMTPSEPSAKQGDRITMNVTADKKEEIHLHDYDIKFEVEPGKTVTKTFTADKTGPHLLEIEDSGTELGHFNVNP